MSNQKEEPTLKVSYKKEFTDNLEQQLEKETPHRSPSIISRLANFIKSRVGSEVITKPVDAATGNIVPDRVFDYHVKINTGAGIIKGKVTAHNAEEAKKTALVEYIKKTTILVELIG